MPKAAPESSAITTSTPTPPEPTQPQTYQVGDELTADVLTAKVLEYKKGFDNVDDGERSDAILVRMCNTGLTADDGEFIFSTLSWSLLDNDEGRYSDTYTTSAPGVPKPAWPDNKLAQGDCAKGWIFYSVPKDTDVTAVAFAPNEEDLGTWQLGQ